MASYQYVYHMDGVSKTYPGGKKTFENIRLNFLPGVKIGVVGVNGAGKSTLLRIMAGIDKDFSGDAWAAKGATVGYLPQEPQLDPQLNVRGNVMEGVKAKQAKLDRYNELAMNYSDETAEEMAKLQDEIDAENLWDLDSQVDVAMEALRCPPDDADVETLSGGERRRVALCKLLLEAPDMLLLDEPTNHLDAETIAWLQKHLIEYPGTILTVTHDRYFLDDITSWILELDRGRGIPYEGNYSAWLEQKAKRLEQEACEDKARQKQLERELDWIRAGAKARQAKQKARINAYNEMASKSEREKIANAQIIVPNGPRLGGRVIEVAGLTKAFGDRLLIENLDFNLPPELRQPGEDPELYRRYLKARQFYSMSPRRGDYLEPARLLLRELVTEHPDYARAWGGLAAITFQRAAFPSPQREALVRPCVSRATSVAMTRPPLSTVTTSLQTRSSRLCTPGAIPPTVDSQR